ncbi:MAG TPA: hypothetical protein VF278_03140 [Pirellulales bacterium]
MWTSDALSQLLRRRTWDKELNVWVGPVAELRSALGEMRVETLDLLDLFDTDNLPIDDDEVRQCLKRELRRRLPAIPRAPAQRLVLLVLSAGLLARYNGGVREFYDWFCNDSSVAFLVIEGVSEANWPAEVECEPKRLIHYFLGSPGLVKAKYGSQGGI